MVASGPDATSYAQGKTNAVVALAMETMYQYTAYFADDDPRLDTIWESFSSLFSTL